MADTHKALLFGSRQTGIQPSQTGPTASSENFGRERRVCLCVCQPVLANHRGVYGHLGDTDAAEPAGAKGSSVVLVFSPLIALV